MDLRLIITATFCLIKALIFTGVGVGTDRWVRIAGQDIRFSLAFGASNELNSSDRSYGQAAYALCIISTLAASLALTVFVTLTWLQYMGKNSEKLSKVLPLVTLVIALIGGIFGLSGCIIQTVWSTRYFSSDKHYSYSPGYSFILTLIGSLEMLLGGGFAFWSWRRTPENFQRF